jgi:hypothetical protein
MSSPGVPTTPNSPYSSYFRRRTIGRASSPPTWACYEQIPSDDDDEDYNDSPSEDESCSEDGEDYGHHDRGSDGDLAVNTERQDDTQNMEIDRGDQGADDEKNAAKFKKDMKGKQKALDPEPEPTKKHYRKRERRPTYTLRPILTIQKSQGFVWNQVCILYPSFRAPVDRLSESRIYSSPLTLKIDVRFSFGVYSLLSGLIVSTI